MPTMPRPVTGLPPTKTRYTLSQLATAYFRWLEAHGYPSTTRQSYGDAIGLFLSFADTVRIVHVEEVSVLAIDGFYVWLRERRASSRTIAHRRSVLIAFWRWLEHEGFVRENVARKTFPIKVQRTVPVYLESHEIETFLTALSRRPGAVAKRDYAMIATLFYVGVRVSELAQLRLSDVDTRAARIRVEWGKGQKTRVLFLPPGLQTALSSYLHDVRPTLLSRSRSESPYLFVHGHGGSRARRQEPLLTKTIYAVVKKRAAELLGKRLSPHKLRHTCASYLLYHGAHLETIQRVLGHTDPRTTLAYSHLPARATEDEVSRIMAGGESPANRPHVAQDERSSGRAGRRPLARAPVSPAGRQLLGARGRRLRQTAG